jgi:hypothetical protein
MPIIEPVALPEKEGSLSGRYPMTIGKAGSNQPGSFWCLFNITGGNDQTGQPATGRTILLSFTTDFSNISDKIQDPEAFKRNQARKYREFMEVVEIDPESPFDTDDFVGKDLEGVVKHYSKKSGEEGIDITKFFKAT